MEIENLINNLNRAADDWEEKHPVTYTGNLRVQDALRDAASALSMLQVENEKLRAELESKEKYYEQMIDALSAADSADLAQMTACVYYKPGGLCRYGGDDPANVCVLGPCPHERTAEEVLADLARVTAERDAAVEDISSVLANAEEIRRGYGVDNADADAAFADLCGNYCAKCGNNCYKEAEDYRCKNFEWRGI